MFGSLKITRNDIELVEAAINQLLDESQQTDQDRERLHLMLYILQIESKEISQ